MQSELQLKWPAVTKEPMNVQDHASRETSDAITKVIHVYRFNNSLCKNIYAVKQCQNSLGKICKAFSRHIQSNSKIKLLISNFIKTKYRVAHFITNAKD